MPSAQVLESKKARAAVVTDLIKNSSAGVLVDYRGITVEEDTQLRKELREAGVTYFVEKNTMLRIALKEAGLDDLCSVLEGTTAIAVCDHDSDRSRRKSSVSLLKHTTISLPSRQATLTALSMTLRVLRLFPRFLPRRHCLLSWLALSRVPCRSLLLHSRLSPTRRQRKRLLDHNDRMAA